MYSDKTDMGYVYRNTYPILFYMKRGELFWQ